ncbi:MAG: hypothetical protein R2825_09855 [Saprospiraceae bacterium]
MILRLIEWSVTVGSTVGSIGSPLDKGCLYLPLPAPYLAAMFKETYHEYPNNYDQ